MKIDTSKITDGVAVRCPKKEYVRPLFEAMGIRNREICRAEMVWSDYVYDTCYSFDKIVRDWDYDDIDGVRGDGDIIIPFEALIIPEESNLIKALHAVEVGDWLKEGVEFEYGDNVFKVEGNCILKKRGYGWDTANETILFIIHNPKLIKPYQHWTPEERQMAEKDSFRFGWVARDGDERVWIFLTKPEWNDHDKIFDSGDSESFMIINRSDYPSLQPGECVSLGEIAGCRS